MKLYRKIRKIWRLFKEREKFFTYEEILKGTKFSLKELRSFKNITSLGSYESPYPSIEELEKGYERFFDNEKKLYAINTNDKAQLELYSHLKGFVDESPFAGQLKSEQYRYYEGGDNWWFDSGCSRHLYAILMYFKPKNVIEIGSGFSTALMLDTNEHFLNHHMNLLCIEPRSARLKGLLKESDKLQILEKEQQEVDLSVFAALRGGDLLFIDSSHVSRPFSDVNRQFFEILPHLKKGVIIHLHDIIYPFEYFKRWTITERRAYNEAYMLRAFLQYNNEFEILCFPSYLYEKYPDIAKHSAQSIYLRKL